MLDIAVLYAFDDFGIEMFRVMVQMPLDLPTDIHQLAVGVVEYINNLAVIFGQWFVQVVADF